MGYFNVNTLNKLKNTSTHMHDFTNIFSTYYYHKLNNLPTRERKPSSTLLDNIYIYKYSRLLRQWYIRNPKISYTIRPISNFYCKKAIITK